VFAQEEKTTEDGDSRQFRKASDLRDIAPSRPAPCNQQNTYHRQKSKKRNHVCNKALSAFGRRLQWRLFGECSLLMPQHGVFIKRTPHCCTVVSGRDRLSLIDANPFSNVRIRVGDTRYDCMRFRGVANREAARSHHWSHWGACETPKEG
jgi:hypothetical protein